MSPQLVRIESAQDPRLEPYRDVRERDLVGRQGLFIAEGEVVVRRLLAGSPHRPLSLLLAERRVGKLADAIAGLDPALPVYVAPQAVMDAVIGFPIHRGVLALGRRAEPEGAAALLGRVPSGGVVLALVGIANHDNMGALFRNAAAFGAAGMLLDAGCCDPLYRKAIRVSVGAALQVPYARLSPDDDLLDRLAGAGVTPLALSPQGSTSLAHLRAPGRAALILGPEGPGLPKALLERCATVSIPMASGVDSLNVAVAAAVALHHLCFVASAEAPL